ncbi:MAG: hypothetical protein ABR577_16905 [Pyrinomonadaceae bacterium]
MTNNKSAIKVIKRDERQRQELAENQAKSNKPQTTQQAAREVVANVTSWVSEFQQKRRAETSQAFKNLFADTAQPTEA